MYCKNCGYENDADASFCEKCGENLKNKSNFGGSSSPLNNGINSTTKILIITVIVLVFALAVAGGVLLQMNNSFTPSTNNSSNSSSKDLNVQATWHKIATYSDGYSNDGSTYDVNTRADNVKVTVSGVPLKDNIGMNSQLRVTAVKYIEAEGAITFAGEGELNWGNSELQSKKSSFEFTTTSRKIQILVAPLQLESWEVNVWNYY